MDAYYKIFTGDNDKKKMEAAVAWSKWEGSVSTLSHKPEMICHTLNQHLLWHLHLLKIIILLIKVF